MFFTNASCHTSTCKNADLMTQGMLPICIFIFTKNSQLCRYDPQRGCSHNNRLLENNAPDMSVRFFLPSLCHRFIPFLYFLHSFLPSFFPSFLSFFLSFSLSFFLSVFLSFCIGQAISEMTVRLFTFRQSGSDNSLMVSLYTEYW
jgi:hypothetical protein